LSEVSIEDIQAAGQFFKVATVQNKYNLVDRGSEAVLNYCATQNIGFISWFPVAAGDLAKPGTILDKISRDHRVGPAQVALAWVLKRSSVMLPIHETSKVRHLEENVLSATENCWGGTAHGIGLCQDEVAQLSIMKGPSQWNLNVYRRANPHRLEP
jgi:aryl-alcohol dehydrogenase-like predicted oxidoreductase